MNNQEKASQRTIQNSGWRAIARLAVISLLLPTTLFVAAGRLDWLMGWLYIGVVFTVTIGTRLLVLRVNPDLIAERSRSINSNDIPKWEGVFLPLLLGVCPITTWLIAGLSYRYNWLLQVPLLLQWVALSILLCGGLISSWAMVVNRFFSTVVRIQADRGHAVVSSGPYRFIRHPGYAGTVLVNIATPIVLDAGWAFIPTVIAIIILVIRTALEDRTLRTTLSGYEAYVHRTRYRLLPRVW